MNNQKHTSDLVSQFRHELLKRREELYNQLDRLDDSETTLIDLTNTEIERIQSIFKLIQKGKI
jgi:hypothetical protein